MVRQGPAKPLSPVRIWVPPFLFFYQDKFMLYLIATPIGNLGDITFRAIEVLKSCDYVLCEDTRHSAVLLSHYNIDTPRRSFHKFNEKQKENEVIRDLQQGKNIALISDAGTPIISDPGMYLIQRCQEEDLEYTALPGPCAAIDALVLSALEFNKFQFIGFLPKKKTELQNTLRAAESYQGVTICYESPQRLVKTLALINEKAIVTVARELTKKFEEIRKGTSKELIEHFTNKPPKGEIVLIISPLEESQDWESLSPVEHVEEVMKGFDLSRKEAIKVVAQIRGVSKSEIYNVVNN